jgi:thiol-disulfide isomerase/thioredoxin
MLALASLAFALTQAAAASSRLAVDPIKVSLTPGDCEQHRLRWSPKGATVPLTAHDGALLGSFPLGDAQTPPVAVRLSKREGAMRYDALWIDADRDGQQSDAERLTTEPKDQRGKWWSSFSATVMIPVPGAAARPYPLSLWFVEDPAEPDAKPALRWSRRGWHEGHGEVGGQPVFVLITEMHMDGVFDQRDSWAIATSAAALYTADSRSIERHCWLGEQAWRVTTVDPHGRSIAIEPFSPGITKAQEDAKADVRKPDRDAPRAAQPLAFGSDLAAALAEAKRSGKRVFVDFQTTWCGPCREMEQLVYTAQAVVQAAAGSVAVKLDGDEQRELVKRYGVGGYPTMLLLDAEGQELTRAVGYRGVAQMVEFFAAGKR